MVERVQGFFRLKLKLKRCVSHLFFFFLLEFWPLLVPVRPESTYFDGFRQYKLIQPESAQISPSRHKSGNEKKKKKCDAAPTRRQWHCPPHTTSNAGAAPLQPHRCFGEFFPYLAPTPFGHGWIAAQHASCLPPFQHISVFLSSQANYLHFASSS